MPILTRILSCQTITVFVIVTCLHLLRISPWKALQTTLKGGPPLLVAEPLNSRRSLNEWEYNNTTLPTAEKDAATRLAFISCNRQNMPNPFWSVLQRLGLSVLVWMGDNIYADHTGEQWQVGLTLLKSMVLKPRHTYRAMILKTEKLFSPANPSVIESAFQRVKTNPEYSKLLRAEGLRLVTGTWDDHDYGVNDGDKTYIHKDESKKKLLDFLDVPANDGRRATDHNGVYTMHHLNVNASGSRGRQLKLAIVLLDLRYNKDTWNTDRNVGDFLGVQQWAWLENVLKNSEADVHLIVSSIQVLVGYRALLESWGGFPVARNRLLNLILQSGARNPVFMSGQHTCHVILLKYEAGDIHFAEISRLICRPNKPFLEELESSPSQIQLWEVTSSGLTHSARQVSAGLGLFFDLAVRWLLPSEHVDVRRDGEKQMWTGLNAGVLDFLEYNNEQILSFKIIDSSGHVRLGKDLKIALSTNRAWVSPVFDSLKMPNIVPNETKVSREIWNSIDWTCEPPNGNVNSKRIRLGIQLVVLLGVVYTSLIVCVPTLAIYLLSRLFKTAFCQYKSRKKKKIS